MYSGTKKKKIKSFQIIFARKFNRILSKNFDLSNYLKHV